MAPSSAVELLPLPVPEPTLAGARVLRVMAEATSPRGWRISLLRDLWIAVRDSSMFLLITVSNDLNQGCAAHSRRRPCCPTRANRAQLRSLTRLMAAVDSCVEQRRSVVPRMDWRPVMGLKRINYEGVEVCEAIPITWQRPGPGLPRPRGAGSVPSRGIVASAETKWCYALAAMLGPVGHWPSHFRDAQVHCEPGQQR